MTHDLRGRAALTGAAFAIVLVASFAVGGETPSVDDPVPEIVDFYVDNDAQLLVSAVLAGLSAVLLLFFAGSIRSELRIGEGGTGGLSAVAFAGGTVAAVGVLIFAGLSFTLGDAADELDPVAVQTLNALNADFFFPLAGGMATFLFATGLASIRAGRIPTWLAWAAMVIAVAVFTPAGFFAFLASIAWVLVTSIVLGYGRVGDVDPAV